LYRSWKRSTGIGTNFAYGERMVLNSLEREFNKAMISIYGRVKAERGYNAGYFLKMLSEKGDSKRPHTFCIHPSYLQVLLNYNCMAGLI